MNRRLVMCHRSRQTSTTDARTSLQDDARMMARGTMSSSSASRTITGNRMKVGPVEPSGSRSGSPQYQATIVAAMTLATARALLSSRPVLRTI